MLQMMIRRFVVGFFTLFIVISLTFFLMRFLPGGPFDRERRLPPAIQANIEARYHLGKPLLTQYGFYLNDVLHGDLGPSYKYQSRRVNDIVAESFWNSFQIGFWALLIGTFVGVALGTWAAMSKHAFVRYLLSFSGISSISMPSFIFGGFLVLLFSLQLNLLPAARLETPLHYILPVSALALVPFAYSFLLVRTSVLETRNLGFIRIKQSFGVAEKDVTIKHILRNSLLPLLSIMGPLAAAVITGSFAVEFIFAIPGLGKHFITAVANRDYTLVMGITIIFSLVLILLNTLTDILYGVLDPRLRESARGEV